MKSRSGGNRAVSSLLGATMFIIILLVSFGLIIWNTQSYDTYLASNNSKEDAIYQASSEFVSLTDFKFSQNNKMNLNITNLSPVTVRIVSLWVSNLSTTPQWHKRFNVNIYLNPFQTIAGVGQNLGTFYPSKLYTVMLVTQRGNLFGGTNYKKTTIIGIAQSMGWISIDWDTYMYTSSGNPTIPKAAWNISKGQTGQLIQFQINVTNHWNNALYLLKYTYLRMDKSKTSGNTLTFYLMDTSSTIGSLQCYNPSTYPIILQPNPNGNYDKGGTPVTLKFLGQSSGTSTNCNKSTELKTDQFAVFLVIYYKYQINSQWYYLAQTIPFEATVISS